MARKQRGAAMVYDLVASIPASDFWRLPHGRKTNHIQEANCQKPRTVGDELMAEPNCGLKSEHWPATYAAGAICTPWLIV